MMNILFVEALLQDVAPNLRMSRGNESYNYGLRGTVLDKLPSYVS